MERIPERQITFHPHSFADVAGRLFWWQGQLYRGVRSEWVPVIQRLIKDGVIERLVERRLLIDTEPTALKVQGYEMVLRHRVVPFPSYPEEWCAAMLKDAALAQMELLTELARSGFTLKDAHPWNILFDAWNPVYVDVSSIVPITRDAVWSGYDQFCRFFLNPLILMAHGYERIARRLLPELDGVTQAEVLQLTRPSICFDGFFHWSRSMVGRAAARFRHQRQPQLAAMSGSKESLSPKTYLASLEKLRREIDKIAPTTESGALNARENSDQALSRQSEWTVKQRTIHKILSDRRPKSVLNVGSDTASYSKLAAALGSRVVSFDVNTSRVTELYCNARDKRIPILPLVMDITDPTPARGVSNHWAVPATERFSCELVLALSVLRKIIFERHLNLNQVVDGLTMFATRCLIVEYVPLEMRGGVVDQPHFASSYNLDSLVDALRKRFRSVNLQPVHPEQISLLICEN